MALPGFVERCLEYIRRRAYELDAIRSAIRQIVHPLARRLRRGRIGDLIALGIHAESDVGLDAGRGDLVAFTFVPLLDRPVDAVLAPDFANRGDAVSQPELENVLRSGAVYGTNVN